MPGIKEITSRCQELSFLEDVFKNSGLPRNTGENWYKLGNEDYITYGIGDHIKFEHLEKLSDFGGAYSGDRRNWILESNNGNITITFDYLEMDENGDSQNSITQVLTINDGTVQMEIVDSDGVKPYTGEAMMTIMLKKLDDAARSSNLSALCQQYKQSRTAELHSFFKNVQPEMKTLIDNVVASYM
jgi:hypothetical protein